MYWIRPFEETYGVKGSFTRKVSHCFLYHLKMDSMALIKHNVKKDQKCRSQNGNDDGTCKRIPSPEGRWSSAAESAVLPTDGLDTNSQ